MQVRREAKAKREADLTNKQKCNPENSLKPERKRGRRDLFRKKTK
jgi:hypothetical protein